MRVTLSMVALAVGAASWLGIACGSEGKPGFKCKEQAVANGQTVECESDGQFGPTETSYTCGPVGSISTKSLGGVICPVGTGVVGFQAKAERDHREGDVIGEQTQFGTSSSSGGSSSGGSSSGGSSSGETSSGGSSSGETSSGSSGTSGEAASSSSSGASGSSGAEPSEGACVYACTAGGESAKCVCTKCDEGYQLMNGSCVPKGNNGVGNGEDPQPPGDPPVNDGPGTEPGTPGSQL